MGVIRSRMKLIGAGLPRTATTTQMFALEELGYGPCYHMRDLLADLENGLPLWEAVAAGKPDWDGIFGDCVSTVDWPSARFYVQLMERYPRAKVLLSVRDAEEWVRSMRRTVWGIFHGDSVIHHVSEARAAIDPLWRRYTDLMGWMNWDERDGALVGETTTDEGLAAVMERWNEEVIATVPGERLLVWNPAEGWEPLCDFLEVDVPEMPLPRLNDTASFREGIIGGALDVLNEGWNARERPATGLHGAPLPT
jgi:Sulfotransferase domain